MVVCSCTLVNANAGLHQHLPAQKVHFLDVNFPIEQMLCMTKARKKKITRVDLYGRLVVALGVQEIPVFLHPAILGPSPSVCAHGTLKKEQIYNREWI